MKEKGIKNWEKIRSKGKQHFIWIKGVLSWGILTAILWFIIMEIIMPFENKFIGLLLALFLFPIGGYFWGLWVWKIAEKKYIEAVENDNG